MADALALDLCDKGLVTSQIVLTIGYDIENLTNEDISQNYSGEICLDYLGRRIPKHAHGSANIDRYTSSSKLIMDAVVSLYDRIINKDLLVRRINIAATNIMFENQVSMVKEYEQLDLFTDYDQKKKKDKKLEEELVKEKKAQEAMLKIKKKYGKNAVMKGMNLEDGATMKERNEQIGGHKA